MKYIQNKKVLVASRIRTQDIWLDGTSTLTTELMRLLLDFNYLYENFTINI